MTPLCEALPAVVLSAMLLGGFVACSVSYLMEKQTTGSTLPATVDAPFPNAIFPLLEIVTRLFSPQPTVSLTHRFVEESVIEYSYRDLVAITLRLLLLTLKLKLMLMLLLLLVLVLMVGNGRGRGL